MTLCPVILAGGGGTRLWPLSREYYPKQFLPLFSEYSLLQETLLRLDGLRKDIPVLDPVIVCNEEHRFLVAEQAAAAGVTLQTIMLEPEGRNTAPALTVTAIFLRAQDLDPVMVMMPADHQITDVQELQNAIKQGYQLAQKDRLITFGIRPRSAETGYGYIQYGGPLAETAGGGCYRIKSFTEKPGREVAEQYLSAGNYLWNSGIFMMKASIWCDVMKRLQPDIHEACLRAYAEGGRDNHFYRLHRENFLSCRSDSIDYAVVEKLSGEENANTAVIDINAGWSDVGAWSAAWQLGRQDRDRNVTVGDVLLHDSTDNLVRSEKRLVAAVGVHNMVIVETADSVLVADMDKAQDIKKIIEQLKSAGRQELLTHRRVYRPWGSYETVDEGENFQVKRLIINPGKKLSLQSHGKRAEHWVVVKGTARVTKGDDVFQLNVNESTYIPVGTKHRLENATSDPLEIIEVQSG
ncbi:MAG: mannose-1-phosphate guanylyltransferase/mannose-6-phosphate isomerase, partial [Gammaproteobacteria bacterium]